MDSPSLSKVSIPTSSTVTLDSLPHVDAPVVASSFPCRETRSGTLVQTSPCPKEGFHHERPLSTLRLVLAHFGGALALFLATTDATIVSTSLPTIVEDLHASQSAYTWVGVSYMLTQTCVQPLYGKLSYVIGRKLLMYLSILIFAVGSALCGSAKSSAWLIGARAFAGIGGGGIVNSVWTITAEIVSPDDRAKWSQALSITWSCSAIAGPLLGGAFSSSTILGLAGWRWAFYINLPICLVAFLILSMSLRHIQLDNPHEKAWRDLARRFDFLGLLFFMTGSSAIVIGFTLGPEFGWTSARTLSLIIIGPLALACGAFYEIRTTRDALFSPTTFKDVSAGIILVVSFLHNVAFTAGTFYLALFYQAVEGQTPLQAGLQLLPYSLGSALISMPAAWFIGAWQRKTQSTLGQKWVVTAGLAISAIGFGVLQLMNERSTRVELALTALTAGVGIGMLFHAPFQIFTKYLKPEELGSGTSAFFLVRFTGATIGLSIAGAIMDHQLKSTLPAGAQLGQTNSGFDWSTINGVEPPELRLAVLQAVATSIDRIWTFCTPCLAFAAVIACFLRVSATHDTTTLTPNHKKRVSSMTEKQEV